MLRQPDVKTGVKRIPSCCQMLTATHAALVRRTATAPIKSSTPIPGLLMIDGRKRPLPSGGMMPAIFTQILP